MTSSPKEHGVTGADGQLGAPAYPVDSPPSAQTIRFTSNIVGPLLVLRDLLGFALAVPIAYAIYHLVLGNHLIESVHLFAGTAMIGTFFLLRISKDAYLQNLFTINDRRDIAIFDAFMSGLVATALVFLAGMVENFSRGMSALYLATTMTLLALSQWPFHRLLDILSKRGVIGQRIAFYGADRDSVATIQSMLDREMPHLDFIGIADDRQQFHEKSTLPFLGGSEQLTALARAGEVDQVFICSRDLPAARLKEIMDQLSSVCVDISLVPHQALDLAPGYGVRMYGALPVLTLWQRPWRDVSSLLKRAEDVILALLALLFASPVMLLAAVAIRLTSAGPIYFVQPRIGFNNEVINVFKFRSMYVDRGDHQGFETTTRADPRVTPVGRVLRRLSIDELPQLLNVMKGEMSIVGPRPHATHMRVGDIYYQELVKGYAGRHRVKPGITGLAQVKGLRGEIRTLDRAKRRVDLDQQYMRNWSVWLDLWILVLTVRAVFMDSDAY